MLRVGLTGGIGAGKSAAARRLASLGAVVIDADRVAREVVEPGTATLSAIVATFGTEVLHADGTLDRAALAAVVFASPSALATLEALTHPAIWERTARLFAQVGPDQISVHDMPLLAEKDLAGDYHLTICVAASVQTRLRRLVSLRGLTEAEARARMAAQADDDLRRAAADVWLLNEGSPTDLDAAVDRLWHSRLLPFDANLRDGARHRLLSSSQTLPDPTWPQQAGRLIARVRHALGDRAWDVEHIGSTAVAGLPAKDVIDLQIGVTALSQADAPAFVASLASAGFPRVAEILQDTARDGSPWGKRFHGSCDPGRVAHLHVREIGSPGYRWALAFRDTLRADAAERRAYASLKAKLAEAYPLASEYSIAKEPWFDDWGACHRDLLD